jgi:hypothetical protein
MTPLHQAILALLAAHPEVLLAALRERLNDLGGELRVGVPSTREAWRGRLALVLHRDAAPEPVVALTVQVQLERDDDEPRSWLLDHASRHAELRVPSYLVVVTSDSVVAAWAAGPFVLGTLTMCPQVITLVELLEARGLALEPTLRQRITACTDHERLAQWVRRATTTTVAAEVFAS